jgi:hypothetical protein
MVEYGQDANCLGSIREIFRLERKCSDPCKRILPCCSLCLILSALQEAAEALYKDIDHLELYVDPHSIHF